MFSRQLSVPMVFIWSIFQERCRPANGASEVREIQGGFRAACPVVAAARPQGRLESSIRRGLVWNSDVSERCQTSIGQNYGARASLCSLANVHSVLLEALWDD